MKKQLVIVGIAVLLICVGLSGCFEEPSTNGGISGESKTLYVDDSGGKDHTRIQDAIDAANDGDTVYVYDGTYYENLYINKSIILTGENKDTSIIDGSGEGDVITINASLVTVSGFTIQNSGDTIWHPTYDSGIDIGKGLGDIQIKDSKIIDNTYGINLRRGSCYSTSIISNTFSGNYRGVSLTFASENTISGNNFINNEEHISLSYSDFNTITDNTLDAITKTHSLYLVESNNNTISDNVIENSPNNGIFLDGNGNNDNIIQGNTITNNERGIVLWKFFEDSISKNNIIINNDISSNNFGVQIYQSDNIIYHNNFVNNDVNANDTGNNIWYSDDLNMGNYWDDYAGSDNNGDDIGDIPYDILGGDNQDRYPLMNPVDI